MRIHGKFVALVVLIIVALVVLIIGTDIWIATVSIGESKICYTTIAELNAMGERALEKHLCVAGDVEPGTIVRNERRLEFVLRHDDLRLKVVYFGFEPLPDTFRDGAQTFADGTMGPDGVFHASKIQAKRASKDEAKPAQQTITLRLLSILGRATIYERLLQQSHATLRDLRPATPAA